MLELCATLNFVLFERVAENAFKIIGKPPVWLKRLYKESAADARIFKCDESFYYLKDFLVEAEAFWCSAENHGRRLISGSWIEVLASGEEFYLEASAIFLDGEPVLLIESLGEEYLKLQAELQLAREMILQREMLEDALAKFFSALELRTVRRNEAMRDM